MRRDIIIVVLIISSHFPALLGFRSGWGIRCSMSNPDCLRWPPALRSFPPTTSMHHSKKTSNSCPRSASLIFQCRSVKDFSSAKNSLIGFKSSEYRSKYTSFTLASWHIYSIRFAWWKERTIYDKKRLWFWPSTTQTEGLLNKLLEHNGKRRSLEDACEENPILYIY